jgi:broad specificity phosphatase PhoE
MTSKQNINFRQLTGEVNFYFIRHGKSRGNEKGTIQGRSDSILSDEGESQARAAGGWFRDKKIDRVYTSSLNRSIQTAELIAEPAGCFPPIEDGRLIELDTGIFTGLAPEKIALTYPEEWNSFKYNSWEGVSGAEKADSLLQRSVDFWNHLIEAAANGEKNCIVVSHAGIMQWLIKATLNDTEWMPLFPIANCGIYKLSGRPGWESKQADSHSIPSYVRTWELLNTIPY